MASTAQSAFNSQLQVGDSAPTYATVYTVISEVKNIDGPGFDRDMADVTNLSSTASFKEFIPTLIDGGEITFEINYVPTSASHMALIAAMKDTTSAANGYYRICWPCPAAAKAISGIATDTEIVTSATHGRATGDPIKFAADTLPTGLSATTTYYMKAASTTTFTVYDTKANAITGGATGKFNFSDSGTTVTVIPQECISTFVASVKSCKPSAKGGSAMSASLTLKISGEPTSPA